jgi:hydroxymethylpyrimidine kinase/phosphomethylpyrimidine kinase
VSLPCVLSIGGNDPTGAAGLAMDVRVGQRLNVRVLPILSCFTVQDGNTVSRVDWLSKEQFEAQLASLLNSGRELPRVIKIGLLLSPDLIDSVVDFYHTMTQKSKGEIFVIFDPILTNGQGSPFFSSEENLTAIINKIRHRLLPICSVLAPNEQEFKLLIKEDNTTMENLNDQVSDLVQIMATYQNFIPMLILSGGHSVDEDCYIVNRLFYREDNQIQQQKIKQTRYPGGYRGTGCALSTATACVMAKHLNNNSNTLESTTQKKIIQEGFAFVHHAVEQTHKKTKSTDENQFLNF